VWTKPYFKVKIARLKCTKYDFGWGSAPDPAGGVDSAPSNHLAGFKGPTSKDRGGEGKGREGRGGEGRKDRRGAGEGKGVGRCIQILRGIEGAGYAEHARGIIHGCAHAPYPRTACSP